MTRLEMELTGKVALVTGAGSGIGKAAALRFASEGALVGVLSRTEDEVRHTVSEIEENGGMALPLVADVSDEHAMKLAIDRLFQERRGLDIVFANAGVNGVWAPIDEIQPDEWDNTIAVNLRGTYLTIHLAVPHLKRRGSGVILITSSINGTRVFSNAGATAYSATKAAQLTMGQMLAVELAKHRIRVNVICPGKIDTSKRQPRTSSFQTARSRSPTVKVGALKKLLNLPSSSPPSEDASSQAHPSGSTAPNQHWLAEASQGALL
jgi:NAD(P)-dependent dehydrogenase (short-subunit alcohol dehydrogenase family)